MEFSLHSFLYGVSGIVSSIYVHTLLVYIISHRLISRISGMLWCVVLQITSRGVDQSETYLFCCCFFFFYIFLIGTALVYKVEFVYFSKYILFIFLDIKIWYKLRSVEIAYLIFNHIKQDLSQVIKQNKIIDIATNVVLIVYVLSLNDNELKFFCLSSNVLKQTKNEWRYWTTICFIPRPIHHIAKQ